MLLRTTILSATMIAAPLAVLAEAHANPTVGGAEMSAEMNIVENAMNSPINTTLVAAVQAAGLTDTLKGEGPFTVFAPTDEAFAALPEGTVDALLEEGNVEALRTVLTCHVVAADVMSEALAGMIASDGGTHAIDTVGGCTLQASMDGDAIVIEDEQGGTATVTVADVDQSNGVIHVIDAVLLPAQDKIEAGMMATDAMADDAMADDAMADTEMADGDDGAMAMENPTVGGAAMMADMDIIDNAVNSPIHTTLVAAVQAAGLVDTLKGEGPFTVFAPTDDAFAALPAGTVDTLLQEENRDQLTKVLTAHVVAGRVTAADIVERIEASSDGFFHMTAVSGDSLSAERVPSGSVYIYDESGNAYRVSTADVMQSNGVIHVVDGVLLPR